MIERQVACDAEEPSSRISYSIRLAVAAAVPLTEQPEQSLLEKIVGRLLVAIEKRADITEQARAVAMIERCIRGIITIQKSPEQLFVTQRMKRHGSISP